jgi:hypothetical protein
MAALVIGTPLYFEPGVCNFYTAGVATVFQIRLKVELVSENKATKKFTVKETVYVRSISAPYNTYGWSQITTIQGVALPSVSGFDLRATNVWQYFGERTIEFTADANGDCSYTATGSTVTTATSSPYSFRSGSVSGAVSMHMDLLGKVKVWNGSAFIAKPMKVWDGTAWVEKPMKVWNGSAWVDAKS